MRIERFMSYLTDFPDDGKTIATVVETFLPIDRKVIILVIMCLELIISARTLETHP